MSPLQENLPPFTVQSRCYLYNGPFFLLWITWQTMCLLSSRVKWRSPSRNNDQIYHPPPTTKHLWDLLLSRCGGSYCKPTVISESWNVEQPEARIRKRKRDEAQSVAAEFQRDYGLVFWHHIYKTVPWKSFILLEVFFFLHFVILQSQIYCIYFLMILCDRPTKVEHNCVVEGKV